MFLRQITDHALAQNAYLIGCQRSGEAIVIDPEREPATFLTGDFIFVGDVGRPDLLESAAGQAGVMEPSARTLYASLRATADLPGHLQILPAHGAGRACGKALGAVPTSVMGYERKFNAAFREALDGEEDAFVKQILSGQPEPPLYFARMKRDNRLGPALLPGGEWVEDFC